MTDVKPIRMAEVERLRGAAAGTPDGDRLDVLATLIDAYESERDPTRPARGPAWSTRALAARISRV